MPLTTPCPDCDDGLRYVSRHGGNDPDVRVEGPCHTCNGAEVVTLCCDGCDNNADEWFLGHKFCAACLANEKSEALVVGED